MTVDRTALVTERFRRSLKRYWWLPVGATIAVGALAFVAFRSDAYESSVSFLPVAESAVLQAADLDGDAIANAVPMSVDAVAISGRGPQQAARDAAGALVQTNVSYNPQSQSVDVTVTGPSRDAVQEAKDFYIERFVEVRRERYIDASEVLLSSLNSRRDSLSTRIAEVDEQLAGLDAGTPGELTAALISERAERADDLRTTELQIQAVEAVPQRPNEIVAVASSNDIDPKARHLITTIALALFAGLAVLTAMYVRAMLDDRIRFEGDVRLATLSGPELPVLRFEASRGALRLASVLQGVAVARSASAVHLIPADGRTDVERLEAALGAVDTTQPRIPVVAHRGLDDDGALLDHSGAVVLVASDGQTRMAELGQAQRDLVVSGTPPAAIVITDS